MGLVRGACPHDCPDTCAFHVTVEDGRATKLAGRARPPHHRGLPLRQGVRLPGARLLARSSAASADPDRRRRVRASSVRRPGTRRWASPAAAARAIERHGPESVLPYRYLGTMGVLQGGSMAARFMDASAHRAGADDLRLRRRGRVGVARASRPRSIPRSGRGALILCWGWNPMSTAPHLWRLIMARAATARSSWSSTRSAAARRASPTSTCARCPGTDGALALGMMRALLDAGLADEEWCRAHAVGYDELVERLGDYPVDRCAALCGIGRGRDPRLAREFATVQPSLLRLGVGAQRHAGAPIAYRTVACLPGARRLVAASRRRLSYIPRRPRARSRPARSSGRELQRGAGADAQHVAARRGADRPGARPAGHRAGGLELEPGRGRARPGPGAARTCARRPVHRRARAVPDRHRALRRRRPAGDDAARAPRPALVVGTPLPDAQRAGDRAGRRVASRTPRSSGCWPRGSGSGTRPSASRTRRCSQRARRSAGGDRRCRAARARVHEDRSRPGPRSARRRRLRHAVGQARAARRRRSRRRASIRCRTTTRRPRWPTRSWPPASRWR